MTGDFYRYPNKLTQSVPQSESQLTIEYKCNSTLSGQMDHKYRTDSEQWSIPYPSNDRDGRQTRSSSRTGDRGNSRSDARGTSRNGDRSRSEGDDRGRTSSIDMGNRRRDDRSSGRSSDRGNKAKGDRGHSRGSREKNDRSKNFTQHNTRGQSSGTPNEGYWNGSNDGQVNYGYPPPYTLDVGMYNL